jgi:formyl-CoA transferase
MIERVQLPGGEGIDIPGVVPKLSETPGRTAWVGPAIGAHAEGVLAALGVSADGLADLRRNRVI